MKGDYVIYMQDESPRIGKLLDHSKEDGWVIVAELKGGNTSTCRQLNITTDLNMYCWCPRAFFTNLHIGVKT